jgi:hypothetical protein
MKTYNVQMIFTFRIDAEDETDAIELACQHADTVMDGDSLYRHVIIKEVEADQEMLDANDREGDKS